MLRGSPVRLTYTELMHYVSANLSIMILCSTHTLWNPAICSRAHRRFTNPRIKREPVTYTIIHTLKRNFFSVHQFIHFPLFWSGLKLPRHLASSGFNIQKASHTITLIRSWSLYVRPSNNRLVQAISTGWCVWISNSLLITTFVLLTVRSSSIFLLLIFQLLVWHAH